MSDLDLEGDFRWNDGSPFVASMWRHREPNGGTRENCGELYVNSIIDRYCMEKRHFICEIEGKLSIILYIEIII